MASSPHSPLTLEDLKALANTCDLTEIGVVPFSILESYPQSLSLERFSDAQSIIVAALAYNNGVSQDQLSHDPQDTGRIARYTWRNNYKGLEKNLKKLSLILKEKYEITSLGIYTNGPFPAKFLAEQAGLGTYGKNSIISIPKYGSLVVLGQLVTSTLLPNTLTYRGESCGSCTLCIQTCPTQAIEAPYVLNKHKCLQHLANSTDILPQTIKEVWKDKLYGCSICQEVCPKNRKIETAPYLSPYGVIEPWQNLYEILLMDEATYRDKFKGNQMAARWIHFKAILRNAILALGYVGDKKALEFLRTYKKYDDEFILDAIEYAIKLLIQK